MGKSRSTRKKVLFSIASTVVFFAVLEWICRILAPPPVAEPIPPKQEGVYRILVLGGSTVAGYPECSLCFAEQLQAGLQFLSPTRGVEVLNLGRPGVTSAYVRTRLRHTIRAGPDLIVVLTGHNEFCEWTGSGTRTEGPSRDALRQFALPRLLRRLLLKVHQPPVRQERAMPDRLVPYPREAPWFREVIETYRSNLSEIVRLSQSHGVPLLLCTAPANLADWPPVHRDLAWASPNPNYDADIAEIRSLIADGEVAEAEARADQVTQQHGKDAMILYLKGRACQRQGRTREALELFVRAKDLDPYPWRALGEHNAAVRSFTDSDGVRIVDLERALLHHGMGEPVGFKLIGDDVHPTPLGNAVIAGEIVREMAAGGHLLGHRARLGSPATWLQQFCRFSGKPGYSYERDVPCLLEKANYAAKTPFYHFGISRQHLERAQALVPNHWQTWANLGVLDILEGQTDEGIGRLKVARRLRGRPLDPDDRFATPYLKEAMEIAGIEPGALE